MCFQPMCRVLQKGLRVWIRFNVSKGQLCSSEWISSLVGPLDLNGTDFYLPLFSLTNSCHSCKSSWAHAHFSLTSLHNSSILLKRWPKLISLKSLHCALGSYRCAVFLDTASGDSACFFLFPQKNDSHLFVYPQEHYGAALIKSAVMVNQSLHCESSAWRSRDSS